MIKHGLLFVGLLLILAIAACSTPKEVEGDAMTHVVCEASQTVRTPAPDLPEGVLLQVLLQDNAADRTSGYRIYSDGRYETRPQGHEWAPGSPLTADQLQTVHQAIQAADLATLSPLYHPQQADDTDRILWTQAVEGSTTHTIAIQSPCRVAAIDTLNSQLVELFKAK